MTFFEEDPKFYWPDEDKSIFDKNTDNTVNIEWRGNTRIFEDYKELAYDYYQCSCHTTLKKIIILEILILVSL